MYDATVKVLLIEDDSVESQGIGGMLAHAYGGRFSLETADRLSTGLERLDERKFDVILLDLDLPNSQGLDVIRRVYGKAPNTPVIVLTKSVAEEQAVEVVQIGVQDYLFKDRLDANLLVRAIRYAIERHQWLAEREQHTRQLQSSKLCLLKIIEKSADGIVIVDREGIVRFSNPAAEHLLDRKAEDLIGQGFDYSLTVGRPVEIDLTCRDGEKSVSEMRVVETDWDGKPAYLVSLHDITERKQAEEAEKKLMQMKDELIASISHGLRTPIFSITGFLELLLDGKVEDPDTQREFLTRAAQDVDRLRALVNDLFDVSQLQAGRSGLSLEEIELNSLIKKTVNYLEALAGKKGISLTYADPGEAMTVKGDPDQLQRVLTHLIANAIKFSLKDSTVQITGGLTSGLVMIKVIDQGPGIATEDLPKVFDRFYQADGPNKRAGRGTGLGLHIAKKIIEAHGGYIGAESDPNMGSTFFFALPELVEKGHITGEPVSSVKNKRQD